MVGKADFSNLTKLTYYSSSYNKNLTSLNLKGDSSLTSVYSSSCGITNVDATSCKSLKTLNVTYNPIKTAKYTFNGTKTATITAGTGGTFYVSYSGSKHTLKAVPDSSYYFDGWYNSSGTRVSTNAEYSTSPTITFSRTAKFKKLATPSNVTVTAYSTTAQKISWSKVSGASGYYVYKGSSKTGSYTYTKVEGEKTTSLIKSALDTGKSYYYYVVAYKTLNGTTVKSDKSAIVSKKVIPIAPSVNLTAQTKAVKITFQKVANVNGYEIWKSISKTGGYSRIKTITTNGSATVTVKNTGLLSNKGYYYKVRSYKIVNGTKVYSDYSSIKYIKTK